MNRFAIEVIQSRLSFSLGFRCNVDKAGVIRATAEGNFAYLFLESLLEEESVIRVNGSWKWRD